MISPNWQNPCVTVRETAGSFMCWPAPLSLPDAAPVGADQAVELELAVDDTGFEPFRHYFSVVGTVDRRQSGALDLNALHKLGDLYLAPAN